MNDKVIERVRKLMAMAADSSSPHEAAIAAKRARSLMDKHQISVMDLQETDDFVMGNATKKSRTYIPAWENILSVAIGTYNDCLVDVCAGNLRFKGYDADVQCAQFMFSYLTQTIKRLCSVYMSDKGYTKYNATVGTAFKASFALQLCRRLKELSKEREALECAPGQSLIIIKMSHVEEKFGEANYKNCRTPIKSTRDSDDAVRAGALHGQTLPLHTELGE